MSLRNLIRDMKLRIQHHLHVMKAPPVGYERPVEFMRLEERVLFSASAVAPIAAEMADAGAALASALTAPAPTSEGGLFQIPDQQLMDLVADSLLPAQSDAQNSSAADSPVEQTLELVILESSVSNPDQLIADLQAQNGTDGLRALEFVILDPTKDGLAQITSALLQHNGVDGIHVVSQGAAGHVPLGSTTLSLSNLDTYRGAISAWQYSMSDKAEILFYGCNLAATEEGQTLLNELSVLTQTDVAASDGLSRAIAAAGETPVDHPANAEAPLIAVSEGTLTDSNLLQFTTNGGNILGFTQDSILVASSSHLFDMQFVGANLVGPVAADAGTNTSDVTASGAVGAADFTSVSYAGLWDGVTAVFDSQEGAILKSTYYVDAGLGANAVDQIRLKYNRDVSLDAQGNLVISYDTGTMTDSAPVAWQDIDGQRIFIDVHYELLGDNQVGFDVGDYDHNYELVIDPTLTWTSFLGGSGTDTASGIALDSSGNVYVTGYSDATWGSPVLAFSGTATEAYVAKLNSSGSLVWNTFLGSSTGGDQTDAIAVDGSGNVYVTGWSGATWGSPVRSFGGGGQDAFVAKLNNSGTLTWNTFLGGSGQDEGTGIAVDGSGNVYISGYGSSTWGSPVRAYGGGTNDAFAVKLNSSGVLTWNTFLGGAGHDAGTAIAVDGSGNAYVTGNSASTWGSPVRAFSSGTDIFAAKLTTAGGLAWNTFLGGSGNDYGNAIALDSSGNVYVGGNSGATWGTPLQGFAGGTTDALVAKLNSSGVLTWNTFVGGSAIDGVNGLAVGSNGSVYITGNSGATWGTPWRVFGGGSYDAFAAELNSSGGIVANSFLGGSGNDYGYGIAIDNSGSVYVAGYGSAAWGTPVRAYSGGTDAFVAKINLTTTLSQRIASASDDAEEEGPTGTTPNRMWLNSTDIELVSDFEPNTAGVQKIGLRFTGMDIPVGSTITNAYLVFRAIPADPGMTNSDPTNLTIKGQLTGNASTFTTTSGNISSRTLTTASAAWSPPNWTTGSDYSSPDISSVVQEIVNQGTWASGNALAIIISGTGHRASPSYDGDPSNAAQLVVTYTTAGPANTPPVNTVPSAQSTIEDTALVFSSGNGNQISINDADAGSNSPEVTLSVTNGTLTLSGTTGLTFTTGTGTANSTMTFRGTITNINTALNGLSYTPTANYNGSATLTLTTIDSNIVSMNIESGLKGFYTFDSSGDLGNDTSPPGVNDGIPNTGTSAAVDGTRGNVIAMTGVDGGGVEVTGKMGSPSNVTLAAWVNLTAPEANGSDAISIGDSVVI